MVTGTLGLAVGEGALIVPELPGLLITQFKGNTIKTTKRPMQPMACPAVSVGLAVAAVGVTALGVGFDTLADGV